MSQNAIFVSTKRRQLMKEFLQEPEVYNYVRIAPKALQIYKAVKALQKGSGVVSPAVALHLKRDKVAVSMQMQKLWKQGYLTRVQRVADSGGIIYKYKTREL